MPSAPRLDMPAEDVRLVRALFDELGVSGPDARALYGAIVSRMRQRLFAAVAEAPSAEAAARAATISAEGIVDLGTLIDPPAVTEMVDHLRAAPLYAAHVAEASDGVARSFEATRRISALGSYARDHLFHCPHLIELANDPHLLAIAEAYLGCPPTIYSFNAWWSFPQPGAEPGTQRLHRDVDDLRFVTLFVYLTPVDEATGPHRFIKHSHDKAVLTEVLRARGWSPGNIATVHQSLFLGAALEFSDLSDALLGDLQTVWTGPAGAAVLADTYGLHMGVPPAERDRLMLWVRYGLGPNRHSFGGGDGRHAGLVRSRVPQTERARYVNRLLLAD
jgi:hypothetical protein